MLYNFLCSASIMCCVRMLSIANMLLQVDGITISGVCKLLIIGVPLLRLGALGGDC